MDNKKKAKDIEKHRTLENENQNDRHNENARAAAELEPEAPRMSTDHI
ncbi:hypothetical protein LCL96_15445 [Rossellomorea aquimaris]|nr:hypothetical protein [Rossellomorea aquimaris]MCA1060333.1 hypothetical protein [Rossellomorea aquimaris]